MVKSNDKLIGKKVIVVGGTSGHLPIPISEPPITLPASVSELHKPSLMPEQSWPSSPPNKQT
jgi:NAD(P)-dependent dehydrogenase (short-subunit alcohol dehydrogenase family)